MHRGSAGAGTGLRAIPPKTALRFAGIALERKRSGDLHVRVDAQIIDSLRNAGLSRRRDMRGSYLSFALWLATAVTLTPAHGPFATGNARAASTPSCPGITPDVQGNPARPTSVSDLPRAGLPAGAA